MKGFVQFQIMVSLVLFFNNVAGTNLFSNAHGDTFMGMCVVSLMILLTYILSMYLHVLRRLRSISFPYSLYWIVKLPNTHTTVGLPTYCMILIETNV